MSTVPRFHHLCCPLACSSPTSSPLPRHLSSLQAPSAPPAHLPRSPFSYSLTSPDLHTPNTPSSTTLSAQLRQSASQTRGGLGSQPCWGIFHPAARLATLLPGLPPGVSSHKPRWLRGRLLEERVAHVLSTTSSHSPGGQVPGGRGAGYHRQQLILLGKCSL